MRVIDLILISEKGRLTAKKLYDFKKMNFIQRKLFNELFDLSVWPDYSRIVYRGKTRITSMPKLGSFTENIVENLKREGCKQGKDFTIKEDEVNK